MEINQCRIDISFVLCELHCCVLLCPTLAKGKQVAYMYPLNLNY